MGTDWCPKSQFGETDAYLGMALRLSGRWEGQKHKGQAYTLDSAESKVRA
jgi:hypothetical protein